VKPPKTRKISAQKKSNGFDVPDTYGTSLPFNETVTYPSYGGRGKRNSIAQQEGFNVKVRVPLYTSKDGTTRYADGMKPGFVTETYSNYETGRNPQRSGPTLRRGRGTVTLKRGGVVGPKNVKDSSQAFDNYINSLKRDKIIKKVATKKTNMAKAGRNTTGKRTAQ
jgi:hypothetical protein